MSAARRPVAVLLGLSVLAAAGGCSGGDHGVPDSKVRTALEMKSIQGHLAIEGNPFCSTTAILNDANEVKDASSSGRVIASRDHTVGIEIIKPFAPGCRNLAERKLDKLARGPKKHGKKGGGGGG
jgi:hypothetical protein